ncbi:MAG: thioesterase [Eubacterium sp.]|nr:thioesterase [Eubacterium sp.]
MSTYREHYSISSHDVDINNNLKPSCFARLMQETGNHNMRDRRPTYEELFDNGQSFIATRILYELVDQIHRYDEIDVHTWACRGKAATFIRCFLVKRGDEIVAKGYSEWAVVNIHTGKLCRTDEIDLSDYEFDEPVEMSIPIRFTLPKGIDYELCEKHQVMFSEVDRNMHMNNTYYLDMIWNHVPDVKNKKMTSFLIRHRAEAPLGSEIEIRRAKTAEPIDVAGGANESYIFKTAVNGKTNIEAIISFADI